jgi:hypothetical protein
MAGSRERRVQWAIKKSQENLDSATDNIEAGRTYPAAEEIFRSVESSLTALLYSVGVEVIEYPQYGGKLTGRQALQPLIRENLLRRGIITDGEYQTYRRLVTDLHHEGYRPGKTFKDSELQGYAEFAEDLLVKTRAATG